MSALTLLCAVLGMLTLVGTLSLVLYVVLVAACDACASLRDRRKRRRAVRQAIEDVIREPHVEALIQSRPNAARARRPA